jgi:hypothetical protein
VTNFASKGSDTGSEQDEDEEIGQLAVLSQERSTAAA